MTDKTVSVPQQAPILEEPFTHAEVNQYYSDMYIHVMKEDRKMPLDMKTLIEVHNFFEFVRRKILHSDRRRSETLEQERRMNG
jgi:hypothetical protein